MERLLKDDVPQIMNKETIRYFIEGLRVAIENMGLSQAVFAEGVTSAVNLSNILRGKVGTSEAMREALARKAGLEVAEIVALGKKTDTETQPSSSPPIVHGIPTGHVNPIDVMTAVSTLVGQYQKNDERMRFWRNIFEVLPIAALIVKDGTVTYQNVKSRELGTQIGGPICDTCTGIGCADKCRGCQKKGDCEDCICPISQAMSTAKATSGELLINGWRHLVEVSPLPIQDHEYYIVIVSGELDDTQYNGTNRRSGLDRRAE